MKHPFHKVALLTLRGLLVLVAATLTPATALPITTGVYSVAPGAGAPPLYFQFTVPAPAGAVVTVDFSACGPFWLAAAQPMPAGFPAQVVGCPGHTVSTISTPGGVAIFRIIAASNNPNGTAPGPAGPCAAVTVAGAPAGMLLVATMDQDNQLGVTAADLGAVISDVLRCQSTGTYLARSDFEQDFDTDSGDIGRYIDVYIYVLVVTGENGGSCGDPGGACCVLLP